MNKVFVGIFIWRNSIQKWKVDELQSHATVWMIIITHKNIYFIIYIRWYIERALTDSQGSVHFFQYFFLLRLDAICWPKFKFTLFALPSQFWWLLFSSKIPTCFFFIFSISLLRFSCYFIYFCEFSIACSSISISAVNSLSDNLSMSSQCWHLLSFPK